MSPRHTAEVFVSDNSFGSHPWLPLITELKPQRDQRAKLEAGQHHLQKILQDTANSQDLVSIVSQVLGFFLISCLEINFLFDKKWKEEESQHRKGGSHVP